MNIFTRIFAYPILEREMSARIADKDAQIVSLKVEIQELRDRLFNKHGMVTTTGTVTAGPHIPHYLTGRQRLRKMVEPVNAQLTPEDERRIEESLTQ